MIMTSFQIRCEAINIIEPILLRKKYYKTPCRLRRSHLFQQEHSLHDLITFFKYKQEHYTA